MRLSSVPSVIATMYPSDAPSLLPSLIRSGYLSDAPTSFPSLFSSDVPTPVPSFILSSKPLSTSMILLSNVPSSSSSRTPSAVPSVMMTSPPSLSSSSVSYKPILYRTPWPTLSPTKSIMPTSTDAITSVYSFELVNEPPNRNMTSTEVQILELEMLEFLKNGLGNADTNTSRITNERSLQSETQIHFYSVKYLATFGTFIIFEVTMDDVAGIDVTLMVTDFLKDNDEEFAENLFESFPLAGESDSYFWKNEISDIGHAEEFFGFLHTNGPSAGGSLEMTTISQGVLAGMVSQFYHITISITYNFCFLKGAAAASAAAASSSSAAAASSSSAAPSSNSNDSGDLESDFNDEEAAISSSAGASSENSTQNNSGENEDGGDQEDGVGDEGGGEEGEDGDEDGGGEDEGGEEEDGGDEEEGGEEEEGGDEEEGGEEEELEIEGMSDDYEVTFQKFIRKTFMTVVYVTKIQDALFRTTYNSK